jgi:hypothetical protein
MTKERKWQLVELRQVEFSIQQKLAFWVNCSNNVGAWEVLGDKSTDLGDG